MLKEFKTFIMRGNVIDLATGVIIGAAFGKIINSLVNDIIMPPIGLIINNIDFKNLKRVIGGTEKEPVSVNYGVFLQNVIEFIIIAFCIFLILKGVNSFIKKEEVKSVPSQIPTKEEELLIQIRDILKNKE
jgi:large conductance mechanosensitive channel